MTKKHIYHFGQQRTCRYEAVVNPHALKYEYHRQNRNSDIPKKHFIKSTAIQFGIKSRIYQHVGISILLARNVL